MSALPNKHINLMRRSAAHRLCAGRWPDTEARLKLLLAICAALALVLLVGCGGSSAPNDPFVGPWRPVGGTDTSASLVIAKGSSGYEAFIVSKPLVNGPMLLKHDGDMLVFPAQNGVERQTFTFHSDSGRLTDKNGSATGVDFELVSRSTSHPQAVSPQSSPDQSF